MLISHPEEKNVPEKPLKTHLRNVGENSRSQIRKMRLSLSVITQDSLARLSYYIGISHDFGKATTYFQNYIRKKRKGDNLTRHSFLSAVVAYHFIQNKGFETVWAIVAYLLIKRHHGNLETLQEDEKENINIADKQLQDILKNQIKKTDEIYTEIADDSISEFLGSLSVEDFEEKIWEFEDILEEYRDNLTEDQQIEFFFVVNLLFSLLIDNDKKDAARLDFEYFDGNLEEPVCDVFAYIRNCSQKEPEKFDPDTPLNQIRNRFLSEIAENHNISPDRHFYTITAPTGIGKTFGCMVFANKLKQQLPIGEGRIIYCLPYTSIIDQNYEEFENIIRFDKMENYERKPQRYLLKHHHLTLKKLINRKDEETYSYKDYLDDRLFVEAWESAFIVTTFVQFFHTVVGHTNRFLKKFHNIVNSIVILDEVQSLPPDYYYLLKQLLDVLGRKFNIYFLLITATQPEILDSRRSEPLSVVNSQPYMESPVFNRVKMTAHKNEQTLKEFTDCFCASFTGDNCLIVMNTKKSAASVYRQIKEQKKDYQIFCLTTFLIPYDRREKINSIKNSLKNGEKIIVVSTQLIEAGVDLSFKYVYRDFGPFDSIVQVAGRCNRNGEYGELGGEMHLIKLINENDRDKPFHAYVYKAILAQYSEQVMEEELYESRDFFKLSQKYFDKIRFSGKAKQLLEAIYEINYDDDGIREQIPVSKFKLIEEYSEESLFILTSSEIQADMESMIDYQEELKNKNLSKEDKENILFQIEKLKGKLKAFQLSLKKYEIEPYLNSDIIKGEGEYKYAAFTDKDKIYDQNLGFLISPLEQISASFHTLQI